MYCKWEGVPSSLLYLVSRPAVGVGVQGVVEEVVFTVVVEVVWVLRRGPGKKEGTKKLK